MSLVLLAIAIHTVNGRSGGAPGSACISLRPQHSTNLPQNVPSPHIVNLSSFDSMSNESMNATALYYTPDTMYSSEYGYQSRL